MRTIRDLDLTGKRVLLRLDLNVPITEVQPYIIEDDTRITESMPTLNYLIEKAAQIIIVSHLGRPDGVVVDGLKLQPIAVRLAELLGVAGVTPTKVGPFAAYQITSKVVLLENIRFDAREELNDPDFAKELAGLADVYVNDAFGTAHRAHASTEGVGHLLPAYAGFLVEKEVATLSRLLIKPARPFTVIEGGAKISTKIALLNTLLDMADYVLVGGAMCNNFFVAKGYSLGDSLVEADKLELARQTLAKAEFSQNLILPVDFIIGNQAQEGAETKVAKLPPNPGPVCESPFAIYDIGPETRAMYADIINRSKTIFWNGPVGMVEVDEYQAGTKALVSAIAKSQAESVAGGGDLIGFIGQHGLESSFSYVSTGGGAALEFLEGKELPGLKILEG